MSRLYYAMGIMCLFSALVLLVLVSISLPWIPALDICRITFTNASAASLSNSTTSASINQLRLGTWATCWYEDPLNNRVCDDPSLGYFVSIYTLDRLSWVTISSSLTRFLVLHPVAAGIALMAFLFALSSRVNSTLITSLMAFFAALMTLSAFIADIAMVIFVMHRMKQLSDTYEVTVTSASFWLTFVSFVLLFFSGCIVALGRRRDRMADATNYPMMSNSRWKV